MKRGLYHMKEDKEVLRVKREVKRETVRNRIVVSSSRVLGLILGRRMLEEASWKTSWNTSLARPAK